MDPSPASASLAALMALTLPIALRSMHGICTIPPTGSQVSPRWCSIPISAAFSTCAGVPPITARRAPAAIEQATPTSPWQPTSAPEIEAFSLYRTPIAEAVSRKSTTPASVAPGRAAVVASTAGMIPAAPFVGAVTTRPPAAFSSFTASAYRFTQSMTASGSPPAPSAPGSSLSSERWSPLARRRTASGPGSVPSSRSPRAMQASIAAQIASSPASTSASGRQRRSFSRTIAAIEAPRPSAIASSSSALWYGTGSSSTSGIPPCGASPAAASSPLTTKPPPTE